MINQKDVDFLLELSTSLRDKARWFNSADRVKQIAKKLEKQTK